MTMLLRRQMMQKADGGGLPAEYQQVEYLESSGTQWIDTLYRANNTTTVDITFKYTGPNQNADQNPCGGRSGLNVGDITIWANYQKGLAAHRSKTAYTAQDTGFVYSGSGIISQKMHVVLSPETFTVDGQVYFTFDTPTAWEAAYSMYMFRARNGTSGFCREATNFAIYGMKISDSGGLKADFIPCIRIADSKPGMYDLVGRTFYTNQGTGEFIAGLAPDLSDTDYWSIVGYFNASGAITSHLGYRMCDYQPIISGNAYTLNLSNDNWKGLGFYDEQYNPLEFSQNANYTNPITITAPANTKYYRIYVNTAAQGIKFELVNPTQ